jgi:hypothetical protein
MLVVGCLAGVRPPIDSSDLILNSKQYNKHRPVYFVLLPCFCHYFDRLFTVSVNITRKCGSLYRLSCFSLYVWGEWGVGGCAAVGLESEISLTRIDLQFPGNPPRATRNEHNRRFGSPKFLEGTACIQDT